MQKAGTTPQAPRIRICMLALKLGKPWLRAYHQQGEGERQGKAMPDGARRHGTRREEVILVLLQGTLSGNNMKQV